MHLVTSPPHGVGSADEQSLQFWELESSKSTEHNCSILQNGGRLYLGKFSSFYKFWGIQVPQSLSNPGETVCIGGFSEAGEAEWGFQNLLSGHCMVGGLPAWLTLYGGVPWGLPGGLIHVCSLRWVLDALTMGGGGAREMHIGKFKFTGRGWNQQKTLTLSISLTNCWSSDSTFCT